MTTSSIVTTTHTLAAAVADTATFTVPYPTGFDQDALTGTTDGEVLVGENDVWQQDDPGFAFAFGASNITVTNNTGATLAAATDLKISFGDRTKAGVYNPDVRVEGPAALTDNSGGTAADTIAVIGATYDQAEVANAVASLAAQVNELRTALKTAGVTR
jgi:hypothetical protein